MVAHQLDLFGGPLKPPKKIKVDDDLPFEEPQQLITEKAVDDVANEPELIADIPVEEEKIATGLDEIISNDAEWVKGGEEPIGIPNEPGIASEQNEETIAATMPDEGEEIILPPNGEETLLTEPETDEAENFTDEAIFANGISEDEHSAVDTSDDEHSEVDTNIENATAEPFINTDSLSEIELAEREPVAETVQNRSRKQISEPGEYEAEGLNVPPDEELFKRQYYSMRETSAMFGVNQSLLRFWENEFDILQPKKNKKGDRYFRPIDIKNLVLIYHLLRVRKFTLDGAKEYLQAHKNAGNTFELIRRLEKLKSFLLELKAGL
jgi:DNA-binding transcriptional MerR regulator